MRSRSPQSRSPWKRSKQGKIPNLHVDLGNLDPDLHVDPGDPDQGLDPYPNTGIDLEVDPEIGLLDTEEILEALKSRETNRRNSLKTGTENRSIWI